VKCNIAKSGAKPVILWLSVSLSETTMTNLPNDFGKSRGEMKWADSVAVVGRAAKSPPVITAHLMCDGYNAMVC
jgi:hypothetical protein